MRKIAKEGSKEYHSTRGNVAKIETPTTTIGNMTIAPSQNPAQHNKRKMKLVNLT